MTILRRILAWILPWTPPQHRAAVSCAAGPVGAASGAVLRVDPVNDVVVTMVRTQQGNNYKPNLAKFLKAVDEGIVDRQP